jgi:hypothetical protein
MSYKGLAFNYATLPLGMDLSVVSGRVSNSAVCCSSKPHIGVLVVYKYEDELPRSLQRSVDEFRREDQRSSHEI